MNKAFSNSKRFKSEEIKLAFRYTYRQCDECVSLVISKLKNFAADIGKENIVIFSSYSSVRDFDICSQYKGIGSFAIHIPDNGLALPIESADVPFLFLLNEKGQASHIYLPIKEYPEQIDRYFSMVKAKYYPGTGLGKHPK